MNQRITEQQMDEKIREALPDAPSYDVSIDFTRKVMSKIEQLPKPVQVYYTPLITKRGWILIFLVTLVLITVSYLFMPAASGKTLQMMQRFFDFQNSGKQMVLLLGTLSRSLVSSQIFFPIIGAFGLAVLSFLFQQRWRVSNNY